MAGSPRSRKSSATDVDRGFATSLAAADPNGTQVFGPAVRTERIAVGNAAGHSDRGPAALARARALLPALGISRSTRFRRVGSREAASDRPGSARCRRRLGLLVKSARSSQSAALRSAPDRLVLVMPTHETTRLSGSGEVQMADVPIKRLPRPEFEANDCFGIAIVPVRPCSSRARLRNRPYASARVPVRRMPAPDESGPLGASRPIRRANAEQLGAAAPLLNTRGGQGCWCASCSRRSAAVVSVRGQAGAPLRPSAAARPSRPWSTRRLLAAACQRLRQRTTADTKKRERRSASLGAVAVHVGRSQRRRAKLIK